MTASRANPGGHLPVDQIIGRDQLAADAWEFLRRQSLQTTAERRMGKTSLLRKMEAAPPADFLVIFRNLESIHSADQFAQAVYEDVHRHLGGSKKLARRTQEFLRSIGGTEVGGLLKIPDAASREWKTVLARAIEDLVSEQGNRRLVFFWDELPYMLDNIVRRKEDGPATAMEILDLLRSIRQQHADFRMVCTGSIGLHHVLTSLKHRGHSNAAMNDVYLLEVPPLAYDDACDLAKNLIRGETLKAPDLEAAAAALATASDGVAFYIHHLIRHLQRNAREISPESVERAVENQLLDANDPWELKHFRDRLKTYYGEEAPIAAAILDAVATASAPIPVDGILNQLRAQIAFDDRDRLLQLLREMDQDHYLQRRTDGYVMRYPLIARWWRLDRDLPAT